MTAARAALLGTVRDDDHPGAEAIAAGVRDRLGLSVQVVCEAHDALTVAGLVRRVQPAGSPARFEEGVASSPMSTARSARPPG